MRSVANVPSCELRLTNEKLRCVALRGRGMSASKQGRSLLSALGWSEAAPKSPVRGTAVPAPPAPHSSEVGEPDSSGGVAMLESRAHLTLKRVERSTSVGSELMSPGGVTRVRATREVVVQTPDHVPRSRTALSM